VDGYIALTTDKHHFTRERNGQGGVNYEVT